MDAETKKQLFASMEGGHYYIIKLSRPTAPPTHNGVSLAIYTEQISFLYVDCKHVKYHAFVNDTVFKMDIDTVDLFGLILDVEWDGHVKDSRSHVTINEAEFYDIKEIDKEAFDDACNKYYMYKEKEDTLIENIKKEMREDQAFKLDHYMLMADWRNFSSTSQLCVNTQNQS